MNRKKLTISIILLLTLGTLFSESVKFRMNKDSEASDGNGKFKAVKNNEIIDYQGSDVFFKKKEEQFVIWANFKDSSYYFNTQDLDYLENNIKITRILGNDIWVLPYYYDALKANNVSIILDHETYWDKDKNSIDFDNSNWIKDFSPIFIQTGDYFIFGKSTLQSGTLDCFFVPEKIEDRRIYMKVKKIDECDIQGEWASLYNMKEDEALILDNDGDYLYIYKDSVADENLLLTLARANKNILEQVKCLATVDDYHAGVLVYPRHADGTSNYDNEIKPPKIKFNFDPSDANPIVLEPPEPEPLPFSVGDYRFTDSNLKLRTEDTLDSSMIAIMPKRSLVKLIEIGRKEMIDGIDSYWVKIELISAGQNKYTKDIKVGTIGWCFAGYLIDAQEMYY